MHSRLFVSVLRVFSACLPRHIKEKYAKKRSAHKKTFKRILADLTQETANYGSFFGYSLEMKIPVAKSFGFYQLAHNLYHVDIGPIVSTSLLSHSIN